MWIVFAKLDTGLEIVEPIVTRDEAVAKKHFQHLAEEMRRRYPDDCFEPYTDWGVYKRQAEER